MAPADTAHLHLYKDGELLLGWYGGLADPVELAGTLDEADVRAFAASCGGRYAKVRKPAAYTAADAIRDFRGA